MTNMTRNPAGFPQAARRCPLDIAFVARELQHSAGDRCSRSDAHGSDGLLMGGYGVLAAAGATLDPAGGLVSGVPGGLLQPFDAAAH